MTTIESELAAHVAAIQGTVAHSTDVIARIATAIGDCFANGGKVLVCGNGGSAADSQHLAAE
ncbi:MAG: SIS domain-containing protein, partial [Isosphaeraceae bacterium]|nr:SIS domain-containing protein [Isosphaeraceae bacterium]